MPAVVLLERTGSSVVVEGTHLVRVQDRCRRRLERLERMRGLDRAACGHLGRIQKAGLDPRSITIRSSFARPVTPVDLTIYSDRQVPDRPVRPPATRLVRSRGCALQFYLTLLFEAQCRTRAGGTTAPNTIRRDRAQGMGLGACRRVVVLGAEQPTPAHRPGVTRCDGSVLGLDLLLDRRSGPR